MNVLLAVSFPSARSCAEVSTYFELMFLAFPLISVLPVIVIMKCLIMPKKDRNDVSFFLEIPNPV